MVKAANATGISMMIVPIVRSQISRLVCVSIDYPTPRDMDRSRPTGEKRQYRGAARFPGASRRPSPALDHCDRGELGKAECARIGALGGHPVDLVGDRVGSDFQPAVAL